MILAQAPIERILLPSIAVIGLILLGFFIVVQLKRRLQAGEEASGNVGFTLSDLRRLHKSGQMSNEEFEKAKGQVLAAAKRAAEPEQSRGTGEAVQPRGLAREDGSSPPASNGPVR